MDENFLVRNKGAIAQMAIAAIMILSGVFMLQMNRSDYKAPEFTYSENASQNITGVHQPEFVQMDSNCTPLFNSSRRISYGYDISAPSPEGRIRMTVHYDYLGKESVDGVEADIIEIRVNSTHNQLTLNPSWRMWLHPETGQCLKALLSMGDASMDVSDEETYMMPMNCKDAQFGMPVVICEEQLEGLVPLKTESIKVPAGEFQAERYETRNNETVWISRGIPVPIRFVFKSMGDYAVSELMYYEAK